MTRAYSSDCDAQPQTLSPKQMIDKMQHCTVVKRTGAIVPFRRERIARALTAAFREIKGIGKEEVLDAEADFLVETVTDSVLQELYLLSAKGASLTVEGIQDQVEIVLMKKGHHDVARGYIIYRDHHKILREDSPQNLKVQREDGSLVRFNPMKIASAIEEVFRRSSKFTEAEREKRVEAVNFLTQKVVARASLLAKTQPLTVSLIEDEIEQQLMREGFFAVAKDYILQRSARGEQSTSSSFADTSEQEEKKMRAFSVIDTEKKQQRITEKQLLNRLKYACRGLEEVVSSQELLESAISNFYQDMKESEVDLACIMAARAKIEIEPAYSTVAARLLLDSLYQETMGISAADPALPSKHRDYFKKCLQKEIDIHRLHPDMLSCDLDKLARAMQLTRDDNFSYLGSADAL